MNMQEVKVSALDFSILEDIPEVMPILPLRDNVIFPYMIFPVLVGRDNSIKAANEAMEKSQFIFISSQKDAAIEEPTKNDFYREGTIARIIQILKLPNGLLKILVDGILHGRIKSFTGRKNYFEGKIEFFLPYAQDEKKLIALDKQVSSLFKEYTEANKTLPPEVEVAYENIKEIDRRLYYVAANIQQSVEIKHTILEQTGLENQYYELIRILQSELDILRMEKEIEEKVHENISKSQRRYIIQEQIRLLKEELGEDFDEPGELEELTQKIKKAKMPKEVEDKAFEELNKLRRIPPSSPEATVVHNYLDWLVSIPWKKRTKDNLEIGSVEKMLDEDHFGLEKPKERIVEHIAVLNLVKSMRGQILCLVGPPGVGKTSLGKSIARALNRKFVRISLGGVKDEAEIRGHRKTYIGSMPGKIIQSMKRAGTVNPVILLDEIDKMSADFRGDPTSAMLEVLDPEQNNTFQDHYLEVDYDLSQVMFITTANIRYNIPVPLQDRMEIIELPGYLEFEKIEIAKRHIIPRQIQAHGLDKFKIVIGDQVIKKIVTEYTREAGVRNLEREIASVLRKSAKELVRDKIKSSAKKKIEVVIDEKKIEEFLGVPKFRAQKADKKAKIGSVTGLAWTSVGGEILNVEATVMKGRERLTLTGQLGDVMKESAMAALSYLRSNARELKIPQTAFKDKEIHIHLPEGAIPKDGPSAGITMTMAMYSVLTQNPAKSDVAMTGEITLRGAVLPIGGLNEKLLAARRYGIKTVLIPKENERDLKEIKEPVKEGLKIIPVEEIKEAFPIVFGKNWNQKKTSRKK
jgi:ATP-dependent Lon protease